jgi:hypothetical protein
MDPRVSAVRFAPAPPADDESGRRKRGQVYVTGSRNPLFLLTIRNFTIRFSPRPFPFLDNPRQFLPSGTPIMTVIAWGGTGASAVMPTWHHGRGGSVWRFPWGHYDPCAPVEGTQTPGRTLDLIGVTTLRQVQGEARGAAEQAGTEIAGGARGSRHLFQFGRHGIAPRFPVS